MTLQVDTIYNCNIAMIQYTMHTRNDSRRKEKQNIDFANQLRKFTKAAMATLPFKDYKQTTFERRIGITIILH